DNFVLDFEQNRFCSASICFM
ncbi:unnamed protein product, partial [Didymodactylos carnosus]